ncbi:MAG: hypothetical protein AABX51_06125 [Nanoarchaeota archaeon]
MVSVTCDVCNKKTEVAFFVPLIGDQKGWACMQCWQRLRAPR